MKEKSKCRLCKHEWISRTKDPLQCPRCKRYDWKNKKEVRGSEKKPYEKYLI